MDLRFISIILTTIASIDCLKILIIYPTPSYSHQRAILALSERLLKDGHKLFVISPNAVPGMESNHNYTYVDLSFSYENFSERKSEDTVNLQTHISKWDLPALMQNFARMAKRQFLSKQFQEFKSRVEAERMKFDLIIVETFFIPWQSVLEPHVGSAPIISMSTVVQDFMGEDAVGSIAHLSYLPSMFSNYRPNMNLFEKIENWVSDYIVRNGYLSALEATARSYFNEVYGPGTEKLVDGCWGQVDLILMATNSMYYYPRALTPNVVEIGPLHLKTPEKLPENLQNWLDGAEKGVIYFSLGSNMKSKSLPIDVRQNFLKFFKQLPPGYRVLWKWELDTKIPGQPENVHSQKWMPQDSVLNHPKVKVFITQGGLQSFQETVHFGVPTVGIPWFGDQECNVAKMVDAGIGTQLLPHELHSYDKIKSALEAVLFDDKYAKNMKRHSLISRDFSSRGMDQAVFWVEHVAKHGGAAHLRPATADTTLFQYFCLDIISVILVLSCFILGIVFLIMKALVSAFLLTVKSETKTKTQ
nr:PREDICTED: UDP-glucuronosyltransferase 2B18-like [Bemisia tabaci]